jgi:hypothetical protein
MSAELTPDRKYTSEEFWASRPLMKNIKWWASYTVKSPYAILVWAMVQMLTRIPFDTYYVTKTGKNALNMTFVVSGDTGTGKTAARHLAYGGEIFSFDGQYWYEAPLVQLRSGESAGDSFFTRIKRSVEGQNDEWVDEWINLNRAIIFFFDEVLYFVGKQRQNSSTLVAVLLSMWSGEMLGGALAGGKGKSVPAREYRACVVLNSQRETDAFRSDSSAYSGESSRILTVSAVNPLAEADFNAVQGTEPPQKVVVPKFGGYGDRMTPQFHALPEMEAAQAQQDFLAHRGLNDRTRSHEILQRSKIACVLAALDGRTHLTLEDWHLALHLIEHSREVDSEIRAAQARAQRSEAGKSGAILGVRLDAADASREEAALERVTRNLRKWAEVEGYDLGLLPHESSNPSKRSLVESHFSSRDRDFFADAYTRLYNEHREGGEK